MRINEHCTSNKLTRINDHADQMNNWISFWYVGLCRFIWYLWYFLSNHIIQGLFCTCYSVVKYCSILLTMIQWRKKPHLREKKNYNFFYCMLGFLSNLYARLPLKRVLLLIEFWNWVIIFDCYYKIHDFSMVILNFHSIMKIIFVENRKKYFKQIYKYIISVRSQELYFH